MPRNFRKAGSFNKNGWEKMIDGKRHRVHCGDLGLPESDWTKERSYQAACDHWEKTTATPVAVLDPVNQRIADVLEGRPVHELRKLAIEGNAAQKLLAVLEQASIDGEPTPVIPPGGKVAAAMPVAERAALPIAPSVIKKTLANGNPFYGDESATDEINRITAHLKTTLPGPGNQLAEHVRTFLDTVRLNVRPRTFQELEDVLGLLDLPEDVTKIDRTFVRELYGRVKNSKYGRGTQRKHWMIFRRFVRWLDQEEVIEAPGNLMSREFTKFGNATKKIKEYDLAEVRGELKKLPSRLQLYAYLGLNCGFRNVDIASLRPDQYRKGYINNYKRVKTEEHEDVPTVTYRLWPETIELIERWKVEGPTLFVSKAGTRLVTEEYRNGKAVIKDLIALQWKRGERTSIPLKAYRSIAATIIGGHEQYGRFVGHFLGHSPKSIQDKHYVAPSQKLFDKILDWLRKELLG